ncbi:MAG: hypothetical protein B7Y41_03150 [Hydrogenophilales bacterium 28-61-23]|nr:MAG: hypothetical protein B7Y41_03150 [Hydrogenophilales bacterium 28-61-23]
MNIATNSAQFAQSRRPARLLSALLALALAPAAHAVDYTWLGNASNNNWFSNFTYGANYATFFNWSPSGPPSYGSPANIFIDNNPAKSSKVQIAPFNYVAPSPYCTGLSCGISAGAANLTIDSGDTVVIGGSIPFSDGYYYANGQSRLEMIDTGSGATLVNNGVLRLSSEGNNAVLGITGIVTLSGSGETWLNNGYDASNSRSSYNDKQIIYGVGSAFGSSVGPKLVIDAGHTVRGSGRLGYNNTLSITNHGTVRADGPGELIVGGAYTNQAAFSLINTGLMQATNGSRLRINNRIDNSGGVIEALAGSDVIISEAVTGGTLRSSGSGALRTYGSNSYATYLTGLTLEGHLHLSDGVHANFGAFGATNTIVNNGLISVGGQISGSTPYITGSTLTFYGDTTFAGTGRIEMTDDANNKIAYYGGYINRTPVATLGAGQVLTGAGEIKTTLINQGRIEANGALNALKIGSGGLLTNQGEIVVSGAAPIGLWVNGGQLKNEATLTVEAGSVLSGSVTQTAGVSKIQGTLQDGTFFLQGGLLKGTGTINSTVYNTGGIFAPGTSPGTLTIANYTQTAGDLVLEIDGDAYALQDHLTITGNANFYGGRVVLDFSDYTGGGNLSFADILRVEGTLRLAHPVTGAASVFEVVGLGAGMHADVAWNGNALSVALAPVPEPETWAMLLAGLGLVGAFARKRPVQSM